MNIRIVLLLFSVLISIQSYSQKLDSIINSEMKNKNVTETGYIEFSSYGYSVFLEAYLFWTKNELTYVQKFKYSSRQDEVIRYKPVIIKDDIFFAFYKKNKEDLLKENVIQFNYKLDSIVGNKYFSTVTTQSHSSSTFFLMKIDAENFKKQFNHFDLEEFDRKKIYASNMSEEEEVKKGNDRKGLWELETDSIFENHPVKNIHFEANSKLKIVEWDKLITDFIDKMESEDKFSELKVN